MAILGHFPAALKPSNHATAHSTSQRSGRGGVYESTPAVIEYTHLKLVPCQAVSHRSPNGAPGDLFDNVVLVIGKDHHPCSCLHAGPNMLDIGFPLRSLRNRKNSRIMSMVGLSSHRCFQYESGSLLQPLFAHCSMFRDLSPKWLPQAPGSNRGTEDWK